MVNKKKIGEFFDKKNLWNKPFNQFTEEEINGLITVVLSSPDHRVPPGGWVKPFLTQDGTLVIPPEAHPHYRWWDPDGQSIFQTLKEIGASEDTIKRYVEHMEGVPI